MLRYLAQLAFVAMAIQLPSTLVVAMFQAQLPNPFEPLKPSEFPVVSQDFSVQQEVPEKQAVPEEQGEPQAQASESLKSAEDATDVDSSANESAPEPAAEAAAKPTDDEVDDIDKPIPDNTPPIPLGPREDLLQATFNKPYLIEIDGPIDGFFQWYIQQSLTQAKAAQADLVVIKLTSPGGELDRSLSLARTLLELDWAKTVIWIPEEAISGAAIMSLGADAVYMKRSAMIGDAGPIYLTPWGDMVDAEEKVVSYTAEKIRLIAEQSGRSGQVAAAMADRKLKIYSASEKATGLPTFVNEAQAQRADVLANFEIGEQVPESGNDRFLTVGAVRAQQLTLCDEVFESEVDMLQKLSSQKVVRINVTARDRWVYWLNRPWLTTLILIVGIVCLFIEMSAPGVTLPGLISLLSFGLFFWSHLLGGTATGLEIMLFLLGTLALAIELFVLPGFGIFGASGILMIGLSIIMASQDFVIPQTSDQWSEFKVNSLSLLLVGIVLATAIGVQVFWLDSLPGLGRLQLRPEELQAAVPSKSDHPLASLQQDALGVCQSDLRPSGKAIFQGVLVDVLTEGDYVEAGSEVRIIRIEGNIVTVRRVIA